MSSTITNPHYRMNAKVGVEDLEWVRLGRETVEDKTTYSLSFGRMDGKSVIVTLTEEAYASLQSAQHSIEVEDANDEAENRAPPMHRGHSINVN